MKWVSILMVAVALGAQAEEEKPINPAWLKLSVCVQNVAKEFHLLREGGAPDPMTYEKDVKSIDEALEKLVSDGELVERKVDLLPGEDLNDGGFEFLFGVVDELSKDYGHFTALELMDLGLKKRLMAFQDGEPFTLHLRLPGEKLNDLLKKLDEKNLLMRMNEEK